MNRIPSLSLVLLIAGAGVLAAGCNRRDEPTSAGTPTTSTVPDTTSSGMSSASAVAPDATLPPASAASQ